MIEVSGLEKRYGSFAAVKEVSFSISGGEIVGLLGPNGAGKTTIMKILTCYHYPSSGKVSIKGMDIYSDALAIKRVLGYLPENAPVYPELNVKEYLGFIAETRIGKGKTPSGLSSSEAIDRAVEACALKEVWGKGIDTLSKGFRQRVGLAQAILHDPDILILDEPTTGLDPNQILEIRKLISELGKTKTILLSTHILQEVEAVCNRVLILNEGRIVAQGATKDIGESVRGDWVGKIRIKGEIALFEKALKKQGSIAIRSQEVDKDGLLEAHSPRAAFGTMLQFQEALFDAAVHAGVKLLESSPDTTSLEDVFISLTGTQSENKGSTEEKANA